MRDEGLATGTGGPSLSQEPSPALPPPLPAAGWPCAPPASGGLSPPGAVCAGRRWSGQGPLGTLGSWASAHPPHRLAPPGNTNEGETSGRTGAAVPGRGAGCSPAAGPGWGCPALPWLLPEDARGLVRAGLRISQEFGLPLDPKIRVLGTVRVLPALSRSPFSSGAGVSRTTVSETLDAVPQAGALSSTGGGRQGCLCPAGPSGCGWHESVARLSRSRARWHGPSAVSGDRSRGLAPGSTRLLCASCQERSGELRREGVRSPAPSAELMALGGCADSRAGAGRQLSRHPLGVPAPAAPAFVIEPVVPTATRAPVGVRQLWLRWP